jgi:drug/metabolite transporter (DMT)-like permease
MNQPSVTPRLVFILLTLAMLWGSAFVGIKFGLESLSPGHLTLLRQLVASLCFVPFLLLTKRKLFPKWRDVPFFLLLGLLGYTIYHTALNYGEINVSAGTASLIIATAPAFTAIFATFFLSERLAMFGWLGIVLSFAGVALIVLGDNPELGFNLYALLILLSAIVTALYQTLQRPLFKTYSAVEVTAFATWAGTIPLVVFLPGFAPELSSATASSLWAGLYLGIFPSAIAYSLLAYAISKLPVTLVASYLYTVPVFGLLFSWLLLGEIPSWLTVLGGLVALGGIILVNQSKQRTA